MGGFGSIPVDQQRTDRQERDLRTIAEDGSTPHPRDMDTQVPSKKDKKACQSAATEGQRKTPPEQMPGFAYVNWVMGKIAAAAAAAAKPKGKRRRYDNDDKMGEWVRSGTGSRIYQTHHPKQHLPSQRAFLLTPSKSMPTMIQPSVGNLVADQEEKLHQWRSHPFCCLPIQQTQWKLKPKLCTRTICACALLFVQMWDRGHMQ